MSQENQIIQNFLNEMVTGGKPAFQSLKRLLEILEEKQDPDPIELQIVDKIYQYFEQLSHLDNLLRKYQHDANKNLPGNKLSELYEIYSPTGGRIKTVD